MRAGSTLTGTAILIIATTGAVAAGEANEKVTLKCHVVDASGKAVGGADVAACIFTFAFDRGITGRLVSRKTTAADGEFAVSAVLTDADSGTCIIGARKEGLALGWATWDMTESETQRIVLGKSETLKGVVVDAKGKPVAGATVSGALFREAPGSRKSAFLLGIAPMPWGRTTTNARGQFRFTNVPADTKAGLIVTAPGCATRMAPSKWNGPGGPVFTPGKNTVQVRMAPEAVISGTVVDRKTGKGADGVTFYLRRTDKRGTPLDGGRKAEVVGGKFTADRLAAGRYAISLVTPGDETPRRIATCDPDGIAVGAGQKITDAKVALVVGGVIEVVVTDTKTNAPIPAARVALDPVRKKSGPWSIRPTGADGVARFRVLPGRYRLTYVRATRTHVARSFYRRRETPTTAVKEGKTARIEVAMKKKPTLTGVVHDEAGKFVQGAEVTDTYGTEVVARTDEAGRFKMLLDVLPEEEEEDPDCGRSECIIIRHAKRKLAALIEVPKDLTVEVTLRPAASLTGRVVDCEGKPITKARVRVITGSKYSYASLGPSKRVDAKGRFTLSLLPVGPEHAVTARAEGYGETTNDYAFERAWARNAGDIVLETADKVVAGVVVDTNGQPVGGASVRGYDDNGWSSSKSTTTDASGRFEIKGLARGDVSLSVNEDDHSGFEMVKAGDTNAKVVLRKRSSGRGGAGTRPGSEPPDDDGF